MEKEREFFTLELELNTTVKVYQLHTIISCKDITDKSVYEAMTQIMPLLLYLYMYFIHGDLKWIFNTPNLLHVIPVSCITLLRATGRLTHCVLRNTSFISTTITLDLQVTNKNRIAIAIIAIADAIVANDSISLKVDIFVLIGYIVYTYLTKPSRQCPISYIPIYTPRKSIKQKQSTSSSHHSKYISQQYNYPKKNTLATLQSAYIPQQVTQMNNKTIANISKTTKQRIYKMKSKPRGIAVIINNENFKTLLKSRLGTAADAKNLRGLFTYLSFEVQRHDNKTHTEMRQILNDVAAMDHGIYDCLMVAILTHGDYGDVLYGTSGVGITIQEVIETFNGRRCPTLLGKPKIFIIQACRGKRHNQPVILTLTNDDDECDMIDSGPTVYPNISDYLVAYSTIPGHISIRNKEIGSIFIYTLVKIFKAYATDEDLTTMLERVTEEVTKYQPQGHDLQDCMQVLETCGNLKYKLFFNSDDNTNL